MKIKSADKNSVNYPLKKELAPALLSVALSVAGYAAGLSDDNDTKVHSAKAMETQELELHKGKNSDTNNTSLSLPQEKNQTDGNTEKDTSRENIEKPTILMGYTFPGNYEKSYEDENLTPNNTSLPLFPKEYQTGGNSEKEIQRILKLDTPWKKVGKPSAIVGYSSPTYEDIPFKF